MLDEAINQVSTNSLEPFFELNEFKVNFLPPLSHSKRFPCVLERELLNRFFLNSTVVFSNMRRSHKPNFNNFIVAVFEFVHDFKVFL